MAAKIVVAPYYRPMEPSLSSDGTLSITSSDLRAPPTVWGTLHAKPEVSGPRPLDRPAGGHHFLHAWLDQIGGLR
jgi:hypothetical protein